MLKIKTEYLRKPATRENITAAIKEWYDGEGFVLGAKEGTIYWTLGRTATNEEMAFMPTLESLLPVSEFTKLEYCETI
jgi:hypothetical protein